MKKLTKSVVLMAILAMVLFALTGCNSKKLVATKETDEGGLKYSEKIEVSFKEDKADKIVWTMEFEDEDTAKSFADILGSDELEGAEVKQDGKKIVLTLTSKAFEAMSGEEAKDDELTRDSIKKTLEDDGYTVK